MMAVDCCNHSYSMREARCVLTVPLAVFYALYTIALRLSTRQGQEDLLSMQLVFGYLGVFNILIATPVLLLLVLVGGVSFGGMSPLVLFALVFKVRNPTPVLTSLQGAG